MIPAHPKDLSEKISNRAKEKRLQLNITQKELAKRSGVSLGSVKRFEQSGEISLKHLLNIALVLRSLDDFEALFSTQGYQSVDDVLRQKKSKRRKRASGHDS